VDVSAKNEAKPAAFGPLHGRLRHLVTVSAKKGGYFGSDRLKVGRYVRLVNIPFGIELAGQWR
jgi:hypothetical protein